MKRMTVLLFLIVILLCGCQQIKVPPPVVSMGEAVTELNIVTKGKLIGDIQLGFLPPIGYKDSQENFVGWLLLYDDQNFDAVWEKLSTLSKDEITKLSDIEGDNRGYLIDQYEWADAKGNTFNQNQKTLLEGKSLETGIYHFYVATVNTMGVVGLMEAKEIIDIKPTAQNVSVITSPKGYSVSFDSRPDERLLGYFVGLSDKTMYVLKEELTSLSMKDFKKLAKEKKGMYVETDSSDVFMDHEFLTIDGESLDNAVYSAYVVSLGENGMLDLSKSKDYIVENAPLVASQGPINDGLGTVMLIGGGTVSSDPNDRDLFEVMHKAAGGGIPRLALISSSRVDSNVVYDHFYFSDPEFGSFEENYKEMGFEPVFIPLAVDNAKDIRNNPYWVSLLASCQGAFLQGGDQYKHVKALLNPDGTPSELLKALNGIANNGGVVAGTSAGMSALGDFAYGYGYSQEALSNNDLEFYTAEQIPEIGELVSKLPNNNIAVPGIGIVSENVLLDTHFDQRGRLGRLIVAMRDTEKTIGIGVDEGTSFNIQNKIGTVVGHQGVFVLDGSEATYGQKGADTLFSVENLKLHYLTEGDQYDLWTNNATQSDEKIKYIGEGAYESAHQLFGSDYETTKLLIDFMRSEETHVEVPYKLLDGSVLTFYFEKTNETKGYTSYKDYDSTALSGYQKFAIENLLLSVYAFKGQDDSAPVIGYMKSYTKDYKVYLGVTDTLSGLDEESVNGDTVKFVSAVNTLYRAPFYDVDYQEIAVVISEDKFVSGDEIVVEGVKDMSGNEMRKEIWTFDGTKWHKK